MKRLLALILAISMMLCFAACDDETKAKEEGQKQEETETAPEVALFPAKDGDKWGYIDVNGNFVIEPAYDEAHEFSDGLAMVGVMKEVYEGDTRITEEIHIGYIDETGEYVIEPIYNGDIYTKLHYFHDGLAYVHDTKYILNDPEDKDKPPVEFDVTRGFINKKGEMVIDCSEGYNFKMGGDMCHFSEGMVCLRTDEYTWRVFDNKGNIAFETEKRGAGIRIRPFLGNYGYSEGLVTFIEKGKLGYFDKEGNVVIEPAYEDASSFHEGLAAVSVGESYEDDKWGYINKKGEIVIEPQYDKAGNFKDGVAEVEIGDSVKYIDKDGNEVEKPENYDYEFKNGLALIVEDDGMHKYINEAGETVYFWYE